MRLNNFVNKNNMNKTMRHYEESSVIPATAEKIFAYIDDHTRFSSHMNKSSWMMGGGKMEIKVDEGNDQKMGSHILLSGSAFGIKIFLDEVVTRHEPPLIKTWETVGIPKLLIVGSYGMGIEITPQNEQSQLLVYIDYDLPATNTWLGLLFSGIYAKWCVRQMVNGTKDQFLSNS